MKNTVLALLGFFAFSTAFACCSAPPEPVRMEIELNNTYKFAPECVYVEAVVDFSVLPCVDQITLFNSAPAVTIDRPGFVYRNVDYENCGFAIGDHTAALSESCYVKNYRFQFSKSDKQIDSDLVPRCFG